MEPDSRARSLLDSPEILTVHQSSGTTVSGTLREILEAMQPGGKLCDNEMHDGKLHGVFTIEEYRILVRECGINNPFDHLGLIKALGDVTEIYELSKDIEEHGPLGEHKRRVREVAKLS